MQTKTQLSFMPSLIQSSLSAVHVNRDLLINNCTEKMMKEKVSTELDQIKRVWPTSSERSQSSDDDEEENEKKFAFSESEAGQIKVELAFTTKSTADRTLRENRHRRHLSYDDHQIWTKETKEKNATGLGVKRKRQDQDEKSDLFKDKADESLSIIRSSPQEHEKNSTGQMEGVNSTDSTNSTQSSANIYNTPIFSASSDSIRGTNKKNGDLSSGSDSTTSFEECKSPNQAEKETDQTILISKNLTVPLRNTIPKKSQEEALYQDQEKKSDDFETKVESTKGENQNEKKNDEVNNSFPQMLVRAAQRSNTTVFNTAPQRKSCDRCFRMKTKCSRAQPGASTSGPCDGCIRRGFPHDCITSRPDFPHPRITLAKRPRLTPNSSNLQSGTVQQMVNNHVQENGSRLYYNMERIGNRQIDQAYSDIYRYPTQTISTPPQKDVQPMQNSILRREAWVKDQRDHPLPPLPNNLSCRESSSSIYRQRLYHNFGDVNNDHNRLSSLQQQRTATVTSSLAKGQGDLKELSSEELHEISTMVTGELLRRIQLKK